MRWRIRRGASTSGPLLGVVVPAYGVEAWLGACLDSLLAQRHRELDVVVVDDGSPDRSGEIAETYAERDSRVRVLHTPNGGLGAARNAGLEAVRGDFVTFADSDDVVPPEAYATMLASLEASGADFATGSIVRWTSAGLEEPPWMRRLHNPARRAIEAKEHPEVLGDVFAWNKLFRRSFWESAALAWPERVRYEDQPTTTAAYLAGRFDVLPEIVYHWRIREDGSSITQQRNALADLQDRLVTKRMALASVEAYGDAATLEVFKNRVLAGDMHQYFSQIPGCDDDWWRLLRDLVREFWGERSLVDSILNPGQRLIGWLVTHDRRADAELVATHLTTRGPLPRRQTASGPVLDVPGLDATTIDASALRG